MGSLAPLSALPSSTSPSLSLTHPTPAEKEMTWRLNGLVWRGPLSLPTYLRREVHLASQPLTENGGITYWILIEGEIEDKTEASETRTILASCESFRKRALLAHRPASSATHQPQAAIQEVLAHGVGSVFCNPDFRGRGYAGRMMRELGDKLRTWDQPEGGNGENGFSVLYSDIGKGFYSKLGWSVRDSAHVSLPAVRDVAYAEKEKIQHRHGADERSGSGTSELRAGDLKALCERDEVLLRKELAHFEGGGADTRATLVPDVETMQWHHAREEFAAKEILGREPIIKGALMDAGEHGRVWAIWTRTFGAKNEENVLHILRLVVDWETDSEHGKLMKRELCVRAISLVLQAAQREAGRWAMRSVEAWNPSKLVIEASKTIVPDLEIVDRDEESITSLMFYGKGDVEWIGNEKYGWC
ncbi:hypothetical protein MMC19_002202 [Ptychographa xylographoides]|nr:hypothetical protein [Ptychographa xylographoides]